ncbi:hypothetical protein N7462_003979 [Penicillium macrosclerotiorum]|uniref:uncharacterized protein n=1 Tax=Penicillium macrosclerotiorum TaxID=303699 RepID=UPI002546F00B|nr:uncharacterized protein N7462_003979 [Penicillium macrosclerotiorum]KAJ5689587.1 hypothetical protein N7462_003979 [Penicillium macrosclerotiorum]
MAAPAINNEIIDVLAIDGHGLQKLLQSGEVTSLSLVGQYLAQIEKHESKLHAMIKTTPKDLLENTARSLDEERAAGKLRGPLHGIPIIIKDNIATHPDLGLPTSAGSLALLNSKPRRNAKIVDQIIAAGLIILGKANLAEFSNVRASGVPNGWSAVGGQVQSAYVRGGIDPDDSPEGHSNPSGSSSGSAVGVSAGYAPFSIGSETDGSLTVPAGRAALYTIKPTIGLVPSDGIVPISINFDAAGPMTKSPYDLAALLDVLSAPSPSISFTQYLTASWSDISVGVLDPEQWRLPESEVKHAEGAEAQMMQDIRQAYEVIRPHARKFVDNIDLVQPDKFELDGENCEWRIIFADLKRDLNAYLADLEEAEVRSLEEVIEYNNKHADQELPPRMHPAGYRSYLSNRKITDHPKQDILIASQDLEMSLEEYERRLAHLRHVARDEGLDRVLKTHGIDVILAPTESEITSIATGGGRAPQSSLS